MLVPSSHSPSKEGVPLENAELEALGELLLRVAQRADELAHVRVTHTALDLDCWLLAEEEILRTSPVFPGRRAA